jgi:hypothetical protein
MADQKKGHNPRAGNAAHLATVLRAQPPCQCGSFRPQRFRVALPSNDPT